MTSSDIAQQLRERGFAVTLKGEGVSIRPASHLTPSDRVQINEQLDALKAWLRAELLAESIVKEVDALTVSPSSFDLAEDIAALDRERRERDFVNRRGYDFDCSSLFHREYLECTGKDCECLHDGRLPPAGEIIRRGRIELAYTVAPGDSCCIVCGEPWSLRTHGLPFCGLDCYQAYRAEHVEALESSIPEFDKRNRIPTCPLCGGKWRPGKRARAGETILKEEWARICTLRDSRDVARCVKYAFLWAELDDDALGRPYVTTGPYCPWPQVRFGADPETANPEEGTDEKN